MVDEKDSPHHCVVGSPYLSAYEQYFCSRVGFPVLGVVDGYGAYVVALKALGVRPGDEVILPAFCHPLNLEAILRLGAIPVFVDVSLIDYAIDPLQIEEKITSQTKAILVSHLFGQPALGMMKVLDIAKKGSIPVIENASQAFMGSLEDAGKKRLVGTLGSVGCFSFFVTHSSMLIFREKGILYEKAFHIRRLRGLHKLSRENIFLFLGNRELFDTFFEKRKRLASYYREHLFDIGDIVLPGVHPKTECVWNSYVIRTQESEKLFEKLNREKIPVRRYASYFLPGLQEGYTKGSFPVSEKISVEAICLPRLKVFSSEIEDGRYPEQAVSLVRSFYGRH